MRSIAAVPGLVPAATAVPELNPAAASPSLRSWLPPSPTVAAHLQLRLVNIPTAMVSTTVA
jgi:hypothetical protein